MDVVADGLENILSSYKTQVISLQMDEVKGRGSQ